MELSWHHSLDRVRPINELGMVSGERSELCRPPMMSQLEEHSRLRLRSEHISYEGRDARLHRISTIHMVHVK